MVNRTQVFKGNRYQRGFGLGSIFSSIFRAATPLVKSGMKYLGREAIKTGLNTVDDIIEGKNAKQALRDRIHLSKENMQKDAKKYIKKKIKGLKRSSLTNAKTNKRRKMEIIDDDFLS